jgi:hypothetical protein
MRFRVAALLVLAALAGCRAGDTTRPGESFNGSPSFLIQDGAHNGNADFFFLEPMSDKNPARSANYNDGAFNADLRPEVRICALAAANEGAVPGAGYACPIPLTRVMVTAEDGMYKRSWTAPDEPTVVFYRVEVLVGDIRLGFADVKTIAKEADLKKSTTGAGFVPLQDHQTLPIKFRIEQYALCDVPGVGPCASKTINLDDGGTVNTEIDEEPAGVIIPPGAGDGTFTVTVEECVEGLNPRVTDLPTYGPCISVTSIPALQPGDLDDPSIVYICALTPAISGLSDEQQDRVTMHKYHESPESLKSLRRVDACGSSLASNGSLKGFFGALKRGAFKRAGKEAAAMMAPKALNAAARRLDVGAGGEALDWSDFQGALPAMLTIVAGNNQTAAPGAAVSIAPKVQVTDLGGDPVVGALVRFGTSSTACASDAGDLSDNDGYASRSWTLSETPGANTLYVCGRGLAGSDFNGPRGGLGVVDPFQPISSSPHIDGGSVNGPAIEVKTGSVTFSATGAVPFVYGSTLVAFGSGGYSSYGPYVFGNAPAGWPNVSPGVSSDVGSQAPFRGSNNGCGLPIFSTSAGTFLEGHDIFVVKSVNLPVNGTLALTIYIDNDLRIWVDGVEKTSSLPGGSGIAAPNFWQHEGCANVAPATLSVVLPAGDHTISLQARDRGVEGYLDMLMVLNAPPP